MLYAEDTLNTCTVMPEWTLLKKFEISDHRFYKYDKTAENISTSIIYFSQKEHAYILLLIYYCITTKYDSEKSKCQKYQKAIFCLLMQGAYTGKQCDTEKKNDHFNLRIFFKNLIDKIHEMILYIM